jgi:hypothetical protein
VNPIREKKLTNIRAAGKDEALLLIPPRRMSLEQAIAYIEEDELVEVTPSAVRLRKRYPNERKRASRKAEGLDPHERKRARQATTGQDRTITYSGPGRGTFGTARSPTIVSNENGRPELRYSN